ncbi:YdeI/OmpD-associated family protein [Demequina aurantiaca]|uniref:YdeI/OmpD-associated family protein n=1 Tax=Demequina aurantiaca TaxID=676200 RepID=UPI0007820D35|nr:YdeI/OmpD-associated family protein [Demequina aurantiaca]
MTKAPIEEFIVADADAWREWLDRNETASDGVWLVLAKKGTARPTSLRYDQALDEALCSGWIDGQKRSRDAHTFLQRFTPRRKSSMWSQRNIGIVARLTDQGRMRAQGQAEIDRAKSDGRWDRAYAGQATAEVPPDLTAALSSSPTAAAAFAALSKAERYHHIIQVATATTPTTRARRINKSIRALEESRPKDLE